MCGICGYVGDHQPELLTRMATTIAHRGPDDVGSWTDAAGQCGLGQRRLSIIDLSPLGHQPMSNEDGTVWITFNGEIYNYPELREQLIARGHSFRSHTDTEVLVHLFEDHGADMLRRLNGMFAFAIWDTKKRELLLARDHAGVKPLYYWTDGKRLFFASEVKALLQVPGVPREINRERVQDYVTFLWVPGGETMFRGIRKLEPGHYLHWKDGRLTEKLWYSLEYAPDYSISENEWVERVHDTFMRTTQRQMMSDVPLGAFLSGGADSSSIVACMRASYPDRDIRCYTATWPTADAAQDQFVDDYPYAKRVADHLRVSLTTFDMRSDSIKLLPKMVYHLDEPDADPAVFPAYLIAKRAREDGTIVLLSGTGGDEIFFGYRSHEAYRKYTRLDWIPTAVSGGLLGAAAWGASITLGAQGAVARRLRKFRRGLVRRGLDRHLELVDWSSPETRDAILRHAAARNGNGVAAPACFKNYAANFRGTGEINRHTHLLIQTFLAAHNFLYGDKSSMAASIEVRVPFMDTELMQLMARVPEELQMKGGVTKHLLKRAMLRHLPSDILYRSKTGFGVPLRKWISDDLAPMINEWLSEKRLNERGLFDATAVRHALEMNRQNRADHGYLIYALLTLELWMQTFIDRPGVEVTL
ncbi:MAG: asparagine synthase (glutamine-hydrolyzing) [Phycisphaerae bacterium]